MRLNLFYKQGEKNIGLWIAVGIAIVIILAFVLTQVLSGNESSFSMEGLSDSEIIRTTTKMQGIFASERHSGEQSLGFSETRYDEVDYDKVTLQYYEMNGIKALNATKAKDCTVEYSINYSHTGGKMRVVVIIDNKIIDELPTQGEYKIAYTLEGTQSVIIKVIGEKAQFKITCERKINPAAQNP